MTRTSTPKLSEVAKHLVYPPGIVKSGWPAVERKMLDMGTRFDPWQQGVGRIVLGKTADGQYACGIGGVAMSIPRQVGKTFMLGSIVFALCQLHPGMTVLWTAQVVRTANETFRSMQGLAKRKKIAPHIAAIRRGAGDQEVQFTNGSRILFGARDNGFGRGFAEVDIIVFDEAQHLDEKALEDMLPGTNQSRHPAGALVFFIGTPPRPTDKGEVFRRIRDEALAGSSDDTVYIELGADDDCDPDKWPPGFIDWDQVGRANPSYPLRTPRVAILRMIKRFGRASIRRETLGLWDAGSSERALIPAAQWDGLLGVAPEVGEQAYGVKFSGDEVALAVGIHDGTTTHVEALQVAPMGEGIGWLVEWLTEPPAEGLAPAWKSAAAIVIDGKEGAALLADELRKAGVRRGVVVLGPEMAVKAHTEFLDSARAGTLSHSGQAGLSQAVARATKRPIGRSGGWGWRSIDADSVIALEAATLAAHGARNHKRPKTSSSRPRGFVG